MVLLQRTIRELFLVNAISVLVLWPHAEPALATTCSIMVPCMGTTFFLLCWARWLNDVPNISTQQLHHFPLRRTFENLHYIHYMAPFSARKPRDAI